MLLKTLMFKIHQNGVQWKQGVVIYMMSGTSLLYNATPIYCTPLPLHPPVMNTQMSLVLPARPADRPSARRESGTSAASDSGWIFSLSLYIYIYIYIYIHMYMIHTYIFI